MKLPNYTNNLLRLGFTEDDFAEGGSDRLVDAVVACGDVEAVRRRIAAHRDAGADHAVLQVLTDDRSGLPRTEWRDSPSAWDWTGVALDAGRLPGRWTSEGCCDEPHRNEGRMSDE